MKTILIIFSCKKYENRIQKMIDHQYFDLLNETDIDYYVVKGNIELEQEYIIENKHYLHVKCEDTYEGFPSKVLKTMSIISSMYKDEEYVYIKSDDDCIINIKRLLNYVNYIKDNNYVGSLTNYETTYKDNWKGLVTKGRYQGPYMNGASGYCLSKKACEFICDFVEKGSIEIVIEDEKFEDKLIGDILRLNQEFNIKKHDMWDCRPTLRKEFYQKFKTDTTDIIALYNCDAKADPLVLKYHDIMIQRAKKAAHASQPI